MAVCTLLLVDAALTSITSLPPVSCMLIAALVSLHEPLMHVHCLLAPQFNPSIIISCRVEGITEAHVQEAADATAGFSGRELAKMISSIQTAVYGSAQPVLTPELFRSVVGRKVTEHAQRQAFAEGHHSVSGSSGSGSVGSGPLS